MQSSWCTFTTTVVKLQTAPKLGRLGWNVMKGSNPRKTRATLKTVRADKEQSTLTKKPPIALREVESWKKKIFCSAFVIFED